MKHIHQVISRAIKKTGLEQVLNQQEVLDRWGEVVGKKISENSEATKITNGVLSVKTKSPTWRQELQLQKTEIIKKINNELEKKIIKDIRFI